MGSFSWPLTRYLGPDANPGKLALFELSSSWVTGHHNPLTARGYARDRKRCRADRMRDAFHFGRHIHRGRIYVLRTNAAAARLDAGTAVRVYNSLANVEKIFRSLKTLDLRIRPIHHHTEHRTRAHVFLGTLAGT
ncbi:MAG: hypothetical protein ABWY04_05900 [Arthrobacter sp.]